MDIRRRLASRKRNQTPSTGEIHNLLDESLRTDGDETEPLTPETDRNQTPQVDLKTMSPGIGNCFTLPVQKPTMGSSDPQPIKIGSSHTLPLGSKPNEDLANSSHAASASNAAGPKTFSVARALVTEAQDLRVKVDTEEDEPCLITSIVPIPPSTLLVADYEPSHASIKAIDITENLICARLPLPSRPWGLAALPNNSQVAVTLPDEKQIQIVEVDDGLSFVRDFAVHGKCQGIASIENKLVVSFIDPCEIQVMDFFGGLLYSVNAYRPGLPSLQAPYYVSTAKEEDSDVIYVSDFNSQIVFKMTIDGEIVYIYKHLCAPTGIHATGDGHVIVCDFTAYNIFVMSSLGKVVRSLANKRRLPMKPWSVCYWPEQEKLFVGSNRDVVKVFELT